LCRVSHTEEQLTPAGDVLFRNQVIQADQFLFFVLGRLSSWVPNTHVFFILRCAHVALVLSVFMPNLDGLVEPKIQAGFVTGRQTLARHEQ
jgi:hypothetical protein